MAEKRKRGDNTLMTLHKTFNSISGGRTSGYLAANYPADYEVFSIVCVDDPACAHPDNKIMQYANDKIEKYSGAYGEILGTCEDPIIFKTLIELEQLLGREIIWLRGISYDQLIKEMAGYLPNKRTRACTWKLKMEPIFNFSLGFVDMGIHKMNRKKFMHGNDFYCREPIRMRVGYRYDEKERADSFTRDFEVPIRTRIYGEQKQVNGIYHNWRKGDFCLIRDKVVKPTIDKFWMGKNVEFAKDSNCQHCFWKSPDQKRMNFEINPAQIEWASRFEIKNKFDDKLTLNEIAMRPINPDYFYGGDAGCQAGACTN